MLAYHNNPAVKVMYVMRMQRHMDAGELWQGNVKHCAIGCTLNCYSHKAYESELGIPMKLALLEELIFEWGSRYDVYTFPLHFLEAIPVGADLVAAQAQIVAATWQPIQHVNVNELLCECNSARHYQREYLRVSIQAVRVMRDILLEQLANAPIPVENYPLPQYVGAQ